MRTYLVPLVITGLGLLPQPAAAEAPARRVEVLSPIYTVDRLYPSMLGPSEIQPLRLLESEPPELLWVTGFEATMVDASGENRLSQEFMCHSNLDVDGSLHRRLLGLPDRIHPNRAFTLSQGQTAVRFPDGFGLPVASSEPIKLTTQVLTLNHAAEDL